MKAPNEIMVSFNAEHLRIAQQLVRTLRHSIEQASPEAFLKRMEDLRFENRWLNEQRLEALKTANEKIAVLEAKLKATNFELDIADKALKQAENDMTHTKSDAEAWKMQAEIKKASQDEALAEVEKLKTELDTWKFDRRTWEAKYDNEKALRERDANSLDRYRESFQHIALALGIRDNISERGIIDEIDAIIRASAALSSLWANHGACATCPCNDTCIGRSRPLDINVCYQAIRVWARKGDKK